MHAKTAGDHKAQPRHEQARNRGNHEDLYLALCRLKITINFSANVVQMEPSLVCPTV
jgi:hypothetical protein